MGFSYRTWALSWGDSWADSWGVGGTPPVPSQIGGGAGGAPPYIVDSRKYRKKLKQLAKLADQRLYGSVEKRIETIAEEAPTEEIAAVAREIQTTIDFSELARTESQLLAGKLSILLLKLDELILDAINREIEEEDELILLMAIT